AARAAWSTHGTAVFAYGDGAGRVRVTLGRDHRGPNAALRLLPDEAPPLDRLNVAKAAEWLTGRGLILVTGAPGSGKTVTLGALVRALGERQRRVVTIEDPIELVHTGSMISLRAVGEHVPSVRAGVEAAMAEGADAIVVGAVASREAASAVLDAVLGGYLVLTTVGALTAGLALDRVIAYVGSDQRELARAALAEALLGTIKPVIGARGTRTFETTGRSA
ncbi:MAG: Flp pilus assembly complex ATPase component TadA, partial [Myxococcota bacterium]|nr:Flp pilus assembly complex ATPase component TadA [Myxococcota bacterium]